jgi:iron complex outermembrane receptor protein
MGPTQPVFDSASTTGYYEWPGHPSVDNPMAILALATDQATTYRGLGIVRTDYRMPFLPALKANVDLGYDVTYAKRQIFTPSVLNSQTKSGTGGTDFRENPSVTNGILDAYLTYSAPLGAIPGFVDVAGGYSYQQSHARHPWYLAQGLSTDLLKGNGEVPARTVQNNQDIQESKLISFFGRLNYNLSDRYLASVSLRRDGSSRFGSGNAWATFPSVSVGWRISEESFLSGFSALSELKLRGSWAKTGNQAFANYQQYSTYRAGDGQTQVQFGDEFVPTIRPSAVDPGIRWEETQAYNFGLDFGFLSQRISGAVDWYTKSTNDLIFTVPVAAGTNLSNYLTTNIGSMKNRGFEFSLSARVLEPQTQGLAWTATFLGSHNTNELVRINPYAGATSRILTGPVGFILTQVLQPGLPVNSFFMYQHKRTADGKPLYEDANRDDIIDEKDLYEDLNGDGNINVEDRRPFHDPAPKWMLGHSSYLTYRKFDIGFTLRAYLGNYVYNAEAAGGGHYSVVTGGSPGNPHASVLETGFTTGQFLSDYYVEDASFLRMDHLTVGYSFRYRAMPIRLVGTVQNAFTVTDYSGIDPTAGLNGLDNHYPRSRTFTAGLSIGF